MTRLSTLADRNPFRAAWIAVAFLSSMYLVPILLFGTQDATNGTGQLNLVADGFTAAFQWGCAALVLLVLWIMGWLRKSTLIGRSDPAGLRLFLWFIVPMLVLYGFVLSGVFAAPSRPDIGQALFWTALFSLAVGVTEEALFRGLLMHGLRARMTAGRALIVCSVVFAIAHVLNALWGQSPWLTLNQVAFTFAFGALLGAIALQTRSLWPAIVMHGLWDAIAISATLIEDPMVAQSETPDTAAPLGPVISATSAAILAVIILSIGILALIVFRRWRTRMTAEGRRPPALPVRE